MLIEPALNVLALTVILTDVLAVVRLVRKITCCVMLADDGAAVDKAAI